MNHVLNNMWRKTQAGLYAPERLRFSVDRLALYLPLWHPELNGTTIVSKDLNAVSCTTTGTTWGSQGRTIAGDGYRIVCGDILDSIFVGTAAKFSIVIWFKPTGAAGNESIACKWLTTGNKREFVVIYNTASGKIYLTLSNGDASAYIQGNTDNTFALNAWHHLVGMVDFTQTGTAKVTMNVNGVSQALTFATAGTLTTLTDNTASLDFGSIDSGADYRFSGILGEIRVYSRILSASEGIHDRLATIGRYS